MNIKDPIEFLRQCGPTCSPRQLAMVLGGQPYYYNLQAKDGKLDLPHFWRGRNLRIFTNPVIERLGGKTDVSVDSQRTDR